MILYEAQKNMGHSILIVVEKKIGMPVKTYLQF